LPRPAASVASAIYDGAIMSQGEATQAVELFNSFWERENVPERTTERVSADLANLFSYAHQWAQAERRADSCTLTFSSMLAAMTGSELPLCRWLQRHLGLRGVAADTMTRKRRFQRIELPAPLQTSSSFRVAFAKARELCAAASPGGAIDVRHYMAAYAVCPDYHLADFLRLRIDRRAWCLDLADQLATMYSEERAAWLAYARQATPIPVLAFNTDAPDGRDLLNIDREVEAFARLTAARTTITPLSVGVFGAWGSGKSFFMRRVRERVARLASESDDRGSAYHSRIAQIEFNAWHYSEGQLIACLVDHIFRNLRIGGEDDDEATLRRRGAELIVQIDRAKQGLADREREIAEAEARQTAAQQTIAAIDAKIPAIAAKHRELEAASVALVAAQDELAKARERRQAAIDEAVASAPTRAAVKVFTTGVGGQGIATAAKEIGELIAEVQQVGKRWLPILLGVVVLGLGALAAYLAGFNLWAQLISVITALGAFATVARVWLRKLNEIAKRGQEFQAAQEQIVKEAVEAVDAKLKPVLTVLEVTAQTRQDEVAAARDELAKLAAASGLASEELKKLEQQRATALDQRKRAEAEVAAHKEALARLSTGTLLGEFLDERAASDGYRKQLTLFTQVRNDFDRLSKLMARATTEYYESDKPPPTVSRIVLYIDDLDRCPQDKVVEVLRMVHLMLAFPLFVCFVAVDPRWVTECLRRAPGLIDHDHPQVGGHSGDAQTRAKTQQVMARHLEDEVGKPASAADYLEKIFQIPLWLRPVPAAQRPAIVRALLDPTGARSEMRISAPTVTYEAMIEPEDLAKLVPASAVAAIAPPAAAHMMRPAPRPVVDLTIDAVELDYLDRLGELLDGNPRALKRFVNTYRLVKSALSDVELQVFRSPLALLGGQGKNRPRYLPYRMCMAQLAVLCTQRERALEMVRLADRATPDAKLGPWLNELASTVDEDLARCFREALATDMVDLDQVAFSTFKLWLERTRRYSFYL
jgi:hypothetical protein